MFKIDYHKCVWQGDIIPAGVEKEDGDFVRVTILLFFCYP